MSIISECLSLIVDIIGEFMKVAIAILFGLLLSILWVVTLPIQNKYGQWHIQHVYWKWLAVLHQLVDAITMIPFGIIDRIDYAYRLSGSGRAAR